MQARLLQAQKIITGLGDIDIHRIKLLNRCQRRCLPVGDQRPFRYAGFTDATINGRCHFGIGKVDARAFNARFGGDDAGVCLLGRGHGLVILLLADILCTDQREITFHRQVSNIGCRLGLRQLAFGVVVSRLIGCRINLVKRISSFYIAALREVATQDNTANLRTNLCNAERICSAREFSGDSQRCAFHNMHSDLGSLRMLLLVFLAIAS